MIAQLHQTSERLFSMAGSGCRSNTFEIAASTQAPSWMMDQALMKSPVYMKRIHDKVVVLQSFGRMVISQRQYHQTLRDNAEQKRRLILGRSVTPLQSLVRGFQARSVFPSLRAAVTIQRFYRRVNKKLFSKMDSLEIALKDIETRRRSDLQAIEVWKTKEVLRIREETRLEEEEAHALNYKSNDCNAFISKLRKENMRLRAKGNMLREAIDVMKRDNEALVEQSKKVSQNFDSYYKADIEFLKNENSELNTALELLQARKREYQDLLDEMDRKMISEKILAEFFQYTFLKVANMVKERSKQRPLRREVLLLTLSPEERERLEKLEQ